MFNDQILADVPNLVWAVIEDNKVFVATSVLVRDTDEEMRDVTAFIEREGLVCTSDKRLPDPNYLHGQVRYRWFEYA